MLWSAAGCAFELWNVELSGGADLFFESAGMRPPCPLVELMIVPYLWILIIAATWETPPSLGAYMPIQ